MSFQNKSLIFILMLNLLTFVVPCINAMDNSNIQSNSSTPSNPESLTIEQQIKIADELASRIKDPVILEKKDTERYECARRRICGFCYLGDNLLVSSSYKLGHDNNEIKIWDLNNNKCIKKLKYKGSSVSGNCNGDILCALPNKKLAVIGRALYVPIRIFDIKSGKLEKSIDCNVSTDEAFIYENEKKLVLISRHGEFQIINLETNTSEKHEKSLFKLNNDNENYSIMEGSFNFADGKIIFLCYTRGEFRDFTYYIGFFDPLTGKFSRIKNEFGISYITVKPDGKLIGLSLHEIILFNEELKPEKIIDIPKFFYEAIPVKALWTIVSGYLECYDPAKKILPSYTSRDQISHFDDEKLILLSDTKLIVVRCLYFGKEPSLSLFDLDSGDLMKKIKFDKKITRVIKVPKNKIVIGFEDGSIEIWSNLEESFQNRVEMNQDALKDIPQSCIIS